MHAELSDVFCCPPDVCSHYVNALVVHVWLKSWLARLYRTLPIGPPSLLLGICATVDESFAFLVLLAF